MSLTKVNRLKAYEAKLIDGLKESSEVVLKTIITLQKSKPDSEAYETVYAELYARALQLELDAADLRKVSDEITNLLPDEVAV